MYIRAIIGVVTQDSVQIFDPFDDDGDSDDRTLCQMAAFRTSSGCSYEWECVDIPLYCSLLC